MKITNVALISPSRIEQVRSGSRTLVEQGPVCIKFEPSFVFGGNSLTIRWSADKGAIISSEGIATDRNTIVCVIECPTYITHGLLSLEILTGDKCLFAAHITVSRQSSRIEAFNYSRELRRELASNRLAIQSLPFDEMFIAASRSLARTGAKLIFITGSIGKTTTKELLSEILEEEFAVCRSTDSWNFPHEICSQIINNSSWAQIFVMEAALGAHLPLMGAHLIPHMLVFTHLTHAHTAYATDLAEIGRCKASLASHMTAGYVVYNADVDQIGKSLEDALSPRGEAVSRISISERAGSTASVSAALSGRSISVRIGSSETHAHRTSESWLPANIVAAAVAASRCLGVSSDTSKRVLEKFDGVPLRQELIRLDERIVINDAYNASPAAVIALAEQVASVGKGKKRALVLHSMMDLGALSDALHEEVALRAVRMNPLVILVGDKFPQLPKWAEDSIVRVGSVSELRRSGKTKFVLSNSDVIGLKGSHTTELYKVAFDIIASSKAEPLGTLGEPKPLTVFDPGNLAMLAEAEASLHLRWIPGGEARKYTIAFEPFFGRSRFAWCAAFVHWCCNQCGAGLPVQPAAVPWTFALVEAWQAWAQQHGFYIPFGVAHQLTRGDIILFDWDQINAAAPDEDWENHMGVFLRSENGRVVCAEGNADNETAIRDRHIDSVQGVIRLPNTFRFSDE